MILTLSDLRDRIPVPDGHVCIPIDAVPIDDPPDDAASAYGGPPQRSLDPDGGCYVLFTSGTTRRPNGVKVTHRNVCNILLTAPGDLGMRPGRLVGQIFNIAFDMAAWEILGCLRHGATLVIRGKDVAETVERVNAVIATPTILASVAPARCGGVEVAATDGLSYALDRAIAVNTLDAHRLNHLAAKYGLGGQMHERLMRAHLCEGEIIDDPGTLVRLGGEVGVPPEEAEQVLRGDDYSAEVTEDIGQARRLGVTGVPFFVLNSAYGVSGAQPVDTFLAALPKAHPATTAEER